MQSVTGAGGTNWRMLAMCVLVALAAISFATPVVAAEPLDYRRDVQPILSNHCWSCHGPDEGSRKAELRLDRRAAALEKTASRSPAIVPGKPEDSELTGRIDSDDPTLVMPPPEAKKPLTAVQKDILKRWIADGAPFEQHWAFTPPQRPEAPQVRQTGWIRSPIDAFILRQLETAGISPSPPAERSTWLRRVTLDLTGLPPTPQELDSYLADKSASVDEAVVDRLLKSPRHAERMAMQWLDAARYADTNGYNNDEMRTMWPWRDWVIDAFAKGMPYDQFLTEQLAGDLLPNPSLPQRVATGFNRNHVLTTEGGIIEEEYHVEYVADRVHTTSTVFLALSMQCARCHDHKFDPLTQHEYYQFAAFFNNVPDRVVGYSQGRMAEPLLKVPSPAQQAELQRLEGRRNELTAALAERAKNIDLEVAAWEKSLTPVQIDKAGPVGLVAHFPLDEPEGDRIVNSVDSLPIGTVRGKLKRGTGKLGGALEFDGSTFVDAGEAGAFDSEQPFSLLAWVKAAANEGGTVLSKMDDANAYRGYDIILEGGKIASHFVHHWPDAGFKILSKEAISLNEWHHLAVVYDGSRRATGLKLFVDGQPRDFDVLTDNTLSGTLKTDKPFHIGKRQDSVPFKGQIDDVQLYATTITAEEIAQVMAGQGLSQLKELLAVAATERSEPQQKLLRHFFLDRVDPVSKTLKTELAEIPKQFDALDKAIPQTMVMQDTQPRPTYLLKRGQYDQRGDEVHAGVPAVLSAASAVTDAEKQNRLTLARWLTRPDHPLTARVAVNRWWELLFGMGLVETTEDFGIQGARPSHPELLDWLATELIRTGWDQRAILRQIVLSATYRQSARTTPALLEHDPKNHLLSRGPRYRLPAETVRDNALAISGLLRAQIGGPSVKPYQPEGLWEDVSVERREKYVPDAGDGLYRRSMYTFWKRTCPPPGMATFDAPDRETCVIRRARTNTPLQALVLLNDPTYVEAARVLAQQVLRDGTTDTARLASAFKRVLCRSPEADEQTMLLQIRNTALARFQKMPDSAGKLLAVGKTPLDPQTNAAELAAWTTVMNILLNLDEAISKP